MYTSAIGMRKGMQNLDVISNNIANANTTGFKKDTAVFGDFKTIIEGEMAKKDLLTLDEVASDYSQGSLDETGGKYDLAIKGNGFFAVDVEGTEKYTRDGSFTLDKNGYMVDKLGNRVKGEKGNIKCSTTNVIVDPSGKVFDNGKEVGIIKMVDFENEKSLKKSGDNFVEKTDLTKEKKFKGTLMQGYLESSNVNVINEMVEMMNVMRNYETNQKILKVQDEILGKSVNDVGRV
jgi:flagellar basal-body rod protein FlgG